LFFKNAEIYVAENGLKIKTEMVLISTCKLTCLIWHDSIKYISR